MPFVRAHFPQSMHVPSPICVGTCDGYMCATIPYSDYDCSVSVRWCSAREGERGGSQSFVLKAN